MGQQHSRRTIHPADDLKSVRKYIPTPQLSKHLTLHFADTKERFGRKPHQQITENCCIPTQLAGKFCMTMDS
jgi:hypothetical protein